MRKFRNAVLTVLPLTFVPSCFGSTNSCLVTSSNSLTVAGSQTAGAPIAQAGGGTPDDLASLNAAPIPGCNTVDMVFSVFTATVKNVIDLPGTYISTGINQNLATGAEEAVFSSIRGLDNVLTDGDNNDGINNWVAAPGGGTVNVKTNYQAVSSGLGIEYFSLNLNGVSLGGPNATTNGTVSLCLGGTWSNGGVGVTCSGSSTNIITVTTGTNFYSVDLLGLYTTIGVKNTFSLFPGGPTAPGNTYLTSFDETFAETPEPASFILLGTSLAALAIRGFRLRRRV